MIEFLQQNAAFWQRHSPQGKQLKDEYVLVDLLVFHPGYAMGNAILAKLLQRRFGFKLIGILPPPATNQGFHRAFARSYGFDVLFHEDDILPTMYQTPYGQLVNAIKGLEGDALRRAILDIRFNETPIGDLIYDWYLRQTGESTIRSFNPKLAEVIKYSVNMFGLHHWILSRYNVSACITGHVVYSRFAMMVRNCLAANIPVYSRKRAAPPYIVRRYRNLDDPQCHEFRFKPEEITWIREHAGEAALQQGREALEARVSGNESHWLSNTTAFSSERREYSRSELCESLGLNPDAKNVFLMCQVYSDAPHCNPGTLFHDYEQWIRETVRVAKTIPHINFIIKEHPDQKTYSETVSTTGFFGTELESIPNIAFCPENLRMSNLTELANVVVGFGDVTIESAFFGVANIILSKNHLYGHGIAHEPSTPEEYFELLRKADTLPPLTEEQRDTAALIGYGFLCTRVPTRLMPEHASQWFKEIKHEEVFREAGKMLPEADLESDPLYRNFNYMLDHDLDHMMPFDEMGLLES